MLRSLLPVACLLLTVSPMDAAPPVEIVGHRGASRDAPENTVAAMRLAWQQGADGSEFDVYLTRDGHPIVIHDANTERTSGTNLVVAKSTLAELQALDVGRWKGEKFRGERLPLLAEMLAAVAPGKRAYVEIKCGPEGVPAILDVIAAAKLKPEQTPVIAFNAQVVAAVKATRPDLTALWIVSLDKKDTPPPAVADLIAKAKAAHADGLDLSATASLDEAYAKAVKAAGLKLVVWTVNDVAVAKRMVAIGVDGITTDRPGWLRERLAKE